MSLDGPTRALHTLLVAVEGLAQDGRPFTAALDALTRRPEAQPGKRWEAVVDGLEGFFATHGAAATERLVGAWVPASAAVRELTELLGSPGVTLRLLLEGVARRTPLQVAVQPASGESLRVRLSLPRGGRPSVLLFQVCGWALEAVPVARGLPRARVRVKQLDGQGLDCVVHPPAAPRLVVSYSDGRLSELVRHLYGDPDGPRPRARPTTQQLQRRYGLTLAEARVVRRLAEGRSIQRIAEDLEVSAETARTHAKRAMQKTETHRQAELVSLVLNSGD